MINTRLSFEHLINACCNLIWENASMSMMKSITKKTLRSMGVELIRSSSPPLGVCWMSDIATRTKINKVTTILDVGANIGQTSLPLAKRFPDSTVHAFEPTQAAYTQLCTNCVDTKNIKAHHLAIGDAPGELNILSVPNATTNTLRTVANTSKHTQEIVTIATIDQVCQEHHIDQIDILKSDTEGYDLQVLKGASQTLTSNRIRAIVVEVTFDKLNSNQSDFFTIHQLLSDHDFVCAGFYSLKYLMRESPHGAFCDALFLQRSILRYEP